MTFKIIIPTVIFSLIEYVPKHILRGEALSFHTFLSNTIGGGTYWFTGALTVAELVALLLLFSRKASIWFYVISGLAVAILGYYLVYIDYHLLRFGRDPWAYRRGLLAMGFLVIGGLYWRYEGSLTKVLNKFVVVLLLIVYVLIFSDRSHTAKVLISTMDINWIGYLSSLLGCVLFVELCKMLKPISILTFIGQYSLCFYFLSGALPMLVSMLVKRFLDTNHIYGLLIVFVFCLSVAYVITRFFPFLFDLRCLKRRNDQDKKVNK